MALSVFLLCGCASDGREGGIGCQPRRHLSISWTSTGKSSTVICVVHESEARALFTYVKTLVSFTCNLPQPPPPPPTPFCIFQCLQALATWAKTSPGVIAGDGTPRERLKHLRTAMQTSSRYWNRAIGVLRPRKKSPILNDLVIPLLNSLDLQSPLGLRDSLLFCLSLSRLVHERWR